MLYTISAALGVVLGELHLNVAPILYAPSASLVVGLEKHTKLNQM